MQPEHLEEERQILESMRGYDIDRTQAAIHGKRKENLGQDIKAFLEANDGRYSARDPLYDGETGLEAWLQEKEAAATYDVIWLAKEHPEMIVELALVGALKAEPAILKPLGDKLAAAEALLMKKMPGKPTTALQVQKRRDA